MNICKHENACIHLAYEYDMLINTAYLKNKVYPSVLKNAILESFAIHSRNLIEFLYHRGHKRPDDITVGLYISDPTDWIKSSEEEFNKDKVLSEALARASKQIAHLTLDRGGASSTGNLWNVEEIVRRLESKFSDFQASVEPNVADCIKSNSIVLQAGCIYPDNK